MDAADLPEIVTRRQLAEYLGLTEPALSQMAARHQGPKYIRLGRGIRYRREDVFAWLDQRVVDPARSA
jgi:excisionase family DNA binding protein